jgi:hypothetical protein
MKSNLIESQWIIIELLSKNSSSSEIHFTHLLWLFLSKAQHSLSLKLIILYCTYIILYSSFTHKCTQMLTQLLLIVKEAPWILGLPQAILGFLTVCFASNIIILQIVKLLPAWSDLLKRWNIQFLLAFWLRSTDQLTWVQKKKQCRRNPYPNYYGQVQWRKINLNCKPSEKK